MQLTNYKDLFEELWGTLKNLTGSVAEFGVYSGSTTKVLAGITGRDIYAFDTFTGIPKEDYNPDLDQDEPGKFKPGQPINELYKDYPTVTPVVGRFIESLPAFDVFDPNVVFVLVYIDCDLYASAKQVLDWIPSRLVDKTVMVFDDYSTHKGICKAVDEFCEQWKDNVTFARSYGSSALVTWNKDN